ncbi:MULTISPECIES: entericidin A/B family lipoprotein [Alteromonadaceae]|nr:MULTISPECIES: entericidin A/B family lipoprotein [Aliiglaciecola]MBU2877009.1 entericidin A/B family lipoprotein [Aliiglaciecola lipolytica]MDO6712296.1 entericidin A/B family lipoprotein [Aliiglaciecola sp. 2_MG-2023]MDO6753298.1 entericidin A/B family lipoprotein [Aliiglaciecola sp. 1_MG-2023]
MTLQSKIKIILTLTLMLVMLTGCATVEGAGKDIESAGDAIQEAAN